MSAIWNEQLLTDGTDRSNPLDAPPQTDRDRTARLGLAVALGLVVALSLFILAVRAAPGSPLLSPEPNSHTVPATTTVSIT
jgi:hypothetical protein